MSTRKKSKKRHEQMRQKRRPDRPADRRLLRRAILQLFWVAFGVGAMFYLVRNPREPVNWAGIVVWLAVTLAWFFHKALRRLFRWLEDRAARRR